MTYRVSRDIANGRRPQGARTRSPAGVVIVVDLQGGGLRIAKSSPALLHTLDRAERFISGFEGDDRQEGVDQLLTDIRAALQGRMRNGKMKGSNKTSRMRARPVKGRRCR